MSALGPAQDQQLCRYFLTLLYNNNDNEDDHNDNNDINNISYNNNKNSNNNKNNISNSPGTNHWIILCYFLLCTVLYLMTEGDVTVLSGVFSIAFLMVLLCFGFANMKVTLPLLYLSAIAIAIAIALYPVLTLFCCVLLCTTLFYSIVLYTTLLCCILLCSVLPYLGSGLPNLI